MISLISARGLLLGSLRRLPRKSFRIVLCVSPSGGGKQRVPLNAEPVGFIPSGFRPYCTLKDVSFVIEPCTNVQPETTNPDFPFATGLESWTKDMPPQENVRCFWSAKRIAPRELEKWVSFRESFLHLNSKWAHTIPPNIIQEEEELGSEFED
jgi:hypothetical protein